MKYLILLLLMSCNSDIKPPKYSLGSTYKVDWDSTYLPGNKYVCNDYGTIKKRVYFREGLLTYFKKGRFYEWAYQVEVECEFGIITEVFKE